MKKLKQAAICTLSLVVMLSSLIFLPQFKAYAVTTQRIEGQDRYATAIEISKAGWDESDNVVLATGRDFPDALCAAPLAKQLNAPILLTDNTQSDALINEIKRLQVKNVYIIGGVGVISKDIEDDLKSESLNTVRLAGDDRYATSVKIAQYITPNIFNNNGIFLTTGENFPDALSVAPIAASKGMPIILTPKSGVPQSVKEFTQFVSTGYIIGGTGVISDDTAMQFGSLKRISGSDRYETNKAVISMFDYNLDFDKVYAATGEDFPDALAGSALAASSSSPVVLVSNYSPGISVDNFYDRQINDLIALGGEGALPYNVLEKAIVPSTGSHQHVYGNTPGNLGSGGFSAEQGDYIYYYQPNTGTSPTGAIYRIKKDGTGNVKLCNTGQDMSPYINVVGDWIYYRYSTSETYIPNDGGRPGNPITIYPGSVYKIKTDGTHNTKLSSDNARQVFAVDDWIYYVKSNTNTTNKTNDTGIYRIKTDGSGKIRLADISDPGDILNIADGFIFYSDGTGDMYRMNLDGSGKTQLKDGSFMAYGTRDWIYYIVGDYYMSNQIYKTKPDGSQMTVLYDGPPTGNKINISGDDIYFATHTSPGSSLSGNSIFKVKIDGTGLVKTADIPTNNFNITGDYIFYVDSTKGWQSTIYNIKADGTTGLTLMGQ